MFNWLLTAAETLALALQQVVPPGLRGLDALTPDTLDRARPGLITPEPEPPTRVWVWPARR